MFGFHVHGANHYQTKVGAVYTLIYWLLVIATFAYYFFKWRDKSKPSVMWNEYKDESYAEMDLWKENFHFYVLPTDTRYHKHLYWDQFWSSFTIYASTLDRSQDLIGTPQQWTDIPLQKCGEQEWARALPDTDKSKKYLLEYGICLNPLEMAKSKMALSEETLTIRGGIDVGSRRVMIDFYQCLPGRALPTNGVPKTCDTQWPGGVLLQMKIHEKTVNVKYYEQPIASAHVLVDRLFPAKTLRFEATVQIK
jgi:hypothetical protein